VCVPQSEPDHYALLDVHPSASVEQIKAAYLRQVLLWHPDRNPSAEATRRTARINAAWDVLQDPTRRAAYDRRLRRRNDTPSSRSTTRGSQRDRPARPSTPDPAAVERARRGAEASAREAETRRRREEQYEKRRTASAHLWQPPPDGALGWHDRDFVVGRWYRNNAGPYRVIDVRGKAVDVYYPDGTIVTLPRDELWAHWQRQVQRRAGGARPGRATSRVPDRMPHSQHHGSNRST
jgi:curved DNA-binding protein CbpA